MDPSDRLFRDQIVSAVCRALRPHAEVYAGWEGGSAAFGVVDEYSDIDLNFIVDDQCSLDALYDAVESALGEISPVLMAHVMPPGRYYKLESGSEFLLVDLCLYRESASEIPLEPERHGNVRALFDKGNWLTEKRLDRVALMARRDARYQELLNWFSVSQSFVRKAILRGKQVEALASYWGYTLRPLAELLRMRYCPLRWDFRGMRYLDRDLPSDVYEEFRRLVFVSDLAELDEKRGDAEAWGTQLLRELDSNWSAG